jgi:hypothetical protein
MGYMDFNGVRYFDVREVNEVWNPLKSIRSTCIPSDSTKRVDSILLKAGDVDRAQDEKELIE